MARTLRGAPARPRDHGSRRPATAYCRSTTAIPENGPPACYQPERGTSHSRPHGGTPDTRSSVRPRVSFNRFCSIGHRGGLRAQRATFRVLAEGDPDGDAALASAVSCSPPPRSLTPPRPPLSDQRARAARLRRCPDCPEASARCAGCGRRSLSVCERSSSLPRGSVRRAGCDRKQLRRTFRLIVASLARRPGGR